MLIIIFEFSYSVHSSLVNLESENITYDMFHYKSLSVCLRLDFRHSGRYSSDIVRHLEKVHVCNHELWNQCLVMYSPQDLRDTSYIPCNKGILVTTNQQYTYTVEMFNSFHFNITFLRFSLKHSRCATNPCSIHRLLVRSFTKETL